MSRVDMDLAFNDITMAIEKAQYVARNLVEHYELDKEMTTRPEDAMGFAVNRADIGLGVEIIKDYLERISSAVENIEGAVEA